MRSDISNGIKYRKHANDEFYTPPALAASLVPLVPVLPFDTVLDNAPSSPSFYDVLPGIKSRSEDFFLCAPASVDWAITNPPYSKLDDWFLHSTVVCRKGFAYLLAYHNITPRRLEMCERAGFGVTGIHLCKVFKWFGISAFVVFQKGAPSIMTYDRKVWYPA